MLWQHACIGFHQNPFKAPGEALAWLCFAWLGIGQAFLNPRGVRDKSQTASKHLVAVSLLVQVRVHALLCTSVLVCVFVWLTGVTGGSLESLRHYWIYKRQILPLFPLEIPRLLWYHYGETRRQRGACGSYPDVVTSKINPCLLYAPLLPQGLQKGYRSMWIDQVCSEPDSANEKSFIAIFSITP